MATPTPHILIVDDERFLLDALQLYFESDGFRVTVAACAEEARAAFREGARRVDVVVLDLVMPGTHGLDLLRWIEGRDPALPVIIATGCGSMGSAVEALRAGAYDFITKPIVDLDRDLMRSVRSALEVRGRRRRSAAGDSAPSLGRGASPWLDLCRSLNVFASTHLGTPPDTRTWQAVWRLLADGFGAGAAALVSRRDGEHDRWHTHRSWGFEKPVRFGDWSREIVSRISAGTPGSYTFRAADAASLFERTAENRLGTSFAGGDGERPGWSRVLHLPIPTPGPEQWALLLFHEDEDDPPSSDSDPTGAPLALLASVLAPLLAEASERGSPVGPAAPGVSAPLPVTH